MKEQFFYLHTNLQDQIVAGLEAVDGQAKFKEDLWNAQKAAADAHVIENGKVLKRRCEYQRSRKLPCKNVWRRRSFFLVKFGITP
jgi:hypothetical protein